MTNYMNAFRVKEDMPIDSGMLNPLSGGSTKEGGGVLLLDPQAGV